jgi:flagellar biosynthesis protein FlhG
MTSPYRHHGSAGNHETNSRRAGAASSDGSVLQINNAGPKVIAVTSGKGGVGKTNVVANLSVSLSELGKKIVVLDADFGLANIDVLLGLTPRYHLGHVLFGNKSLTEIMVQGPKGIQIIPASSGLQRMSELTAAQRNHLVQSFANLDSDTDYFIIDTAAGISRNVIHFLLSAQEVIVVSAPEPTAIVDAYAVIKIILAEDPKKQIQVLINSVESAEDAHEVFCQINSVVKRFLNREIGYLGHIERDSHVPHAVRSQMLVMHRYPNAPASRCFRDLARRLAQQEGAARSTDGLVWERLLNDWVN